MVIKLKAFGIKTSSRWASRDTLTVCTSVVLILKCCHQAKASSSSHSQTLSIRGSGVKVSKMAGAHIKMNRRPSLAHGKKDKNCKELWNTKIRKKLMSAHLLTGRKHAALSLIKTVMNFLEILRIQDATVALWSFMAPLNFTRENLMSWASFMGTQSTRHMMETTTQAVSKMGNEKVKDNWF